MDGGSDHAPRALLVMPQSGRDPVARLIEGARESLALKIYSLTDPALIDSLVQACARGVTLRAILNAERGDGSRDNDASAAALSQAGAQVTWGSARFAATHEKSLVVDAKTALVSSFNYGEKYFSETRDYGIVTRDPREVAEILACFDADWSGAVFEPPAGTALLWAPGTARRRIAAMIASARKSIDLQHAKLVDTTVLLALIEALDRDVKVRFLCPGGHGLHNWDRPETFAALRILRRAGGKVRRLKRPKMHGNLMLVDGERAQLGSLHFHHVAIDTRRELSIEVDDPSIVAALGERFGQDWDEATRYVPPEPIRHGDTDQAADETLESDPVDADVFQV